eukprot:3026521-Amphidinium_carterae.1
MPVSAGCCHARSVMPLQKPVIDRLVVRPNAALKSAAAVKDMLRHPYDGGVRMLTTMLMPLAMVMATWQLGPSVHAAGVMASYVMPNAMYVSAPPAPAAGACDKNFPRCDDWALCTPFP